MCQPAAEGADFIAPSSTVAASDGCPFRRRASPSSSGPAASSFVGRIRASAASGCLPRSSWPTSAFTRSGFPFGRTSRSVSAVVARETRSDSAVPQRRCSKKTDWAHTARTSG